MTYFNFFDEYRKDHRGEVSVINKKKIIAWAMVLIIACAASYLFFYLRVISLKANLAYIESIKTNPEFIAAYDECLAIQNAGKSIEDESSVLEQLKDYEIRTNTGNIYLLDKLKECISDYVYIDSISLSGSNIEIHGKLDSFEYLEESMLALRNSGFFKDILCDYGQSLDADGIVITDRAANVNLADFVLQNHCFQLTMSLSDGAITE